MILQVVEANNDSRIADWVSQTLPLPVEIKDSSINISLSGESAYLDTRKNDWVDLTESGGNDTIVPITSMPANTVTVDESVNGYTVKAVFSTSGQSCTIYPLVADNSGNYPGYLPSFHVSGIYQNSAGQYESEIIPIDIYGFSQIAFLKSGISAGSVQIKGIPY